MICERLHAELVRMAGCAVTEEGVSISTHVMYPSFEPVKVFISGHGDGYRVHDGGGALQSAWDHGRDEKTANRALAKYARMHSLDHVEGRLVASVPNYEWLMSAVLTVANASAGAAADAVDREVSSEATLADRIEEVLRSAPEARDFVRGYEISGRSGRRYTFDFAVRRPSDGWLLVDGLNPHPASIASRYVAFADTGRDARDISGRLAVYERPLEDADAALMQQVAALVPFQALARGLRAELSR